MTQSTPPSHCPNCNEPVQPTWRICPVCETRLIELTCPVCGQPVKENWKRCPECEALLLCSICRRRVPKGHHVCPHCTPTVAAVDEKPSPSTWTESVCGIEMVLVPGGRFKMGDTFDQGSDNEKPVHEIGLDPFYIGRCCVTQAQWLRLMPENPSHFQEPDRPVEQVTWDDAMQFIARLNAAHHGQPIFDLPTEGQWEYAARSGGRQELYAGGDDIQSVAWYEANSQGHTHPVGTRAPNGLGLCDMSGNVWEWCRDSFAADAYSRHAAHNPLVELSDADRVIRGGSWHLDAWSARCARRFSCAADFLGSGLGFRVTCKLPGN